VALDLAMGTRVLVSTVSFKAIFWPVASPDTTAELGAAHRRRLLDGLAASIREKGLVATQVSDIVRHARASRRTFYNEFADKEACFLALAEELSAGMFTVIAEAVGQASSWEDQVDRGVDAYLGMLSADPALAVTFAVELATLGATGQQLHRRGLERYADLIVAASDPVRTAGLRPVSRHTAIMLIGGLNELVELALANGEPLEQLAPTAKATIKAVLSSPER
jgi:AcrR family transcriptional regulator